MGRGEGASAADVRLAEQLGEQVARAGWVVLTGGRDAGVMAAANRGAKRVPGSLTLGVLPGTDSRQVAPHVDLAIFTGMGDARNVINVLSSDVVVVCGTVGAGSASEAALAVKAQRPLLLLGANPEALALLRALDHRVRAFSTPEQVVSAIRVLTRGGVSAKRTRLQRPLQPMPAFVRAALTKRKLRAAYRARPDYQQNDYLSWITRAKREVTQTKRLAQMLDELERGDRYMNMAWRPR